MVDLLEQRPTPGESVFSADGPAHFTAVLDAGRGDWRAYSWGFRAVAERAARDLETKGHLAGWEVFGFIFLWRHFIELSLKTLIQVLVETGEVTEADVQMRGHKLLPLWAKLAPPLRAKPWGGPPGGPTWAEDFALAERIVKEFDEVDSGSMESRYPGNRDRTASSLQNAPAFINIARLNRNMVWLGNLFDGVFDALTEGDGVGVAVVWDSEEARLARRERVKRERDELYEKAEPLRRAAAERAERELPRRQSGDGNTDDEV